MIGFMHIPKTGGTTIQAAYEQAGYSLWRPKGQWRRYIASISRHPVRNVEADVLVGHLPYYLRPNLPDCEWFTVLRHPVERWLSHRRVLGSDPDPNLITEFLGKGGLAPYFHVGHTERLADTLRILGLPEVEPRRVMNRPRDTDVDPDLWSYAESQNQSDLELWETYAAA